MTEEGDEGRSSAAIRFGEVPSNLRSGDFRMGKPHHATRDDSYSKQYAEQTLGSETSQYQEEKRPTGIPLVAASETGEAQTQPQNRSAQISKDRSRVDFGDGGYKATALAIGRVKKCLVRGSAWEGAQHRVIAPYSKTKHLYGCSS